MADQSSGDRSPAKLDMLGGSQTANIGTVDTRVVGGNMYTTNLSYTNVFTTAPPNERAALPSDSRLFPWNTAELRTLLQQILRPFWAGRQDAGAKDSFLLSNLEESSGEPLPQKTPGEVYVSAMLHVGEGLPCWKPRPRKPIKDGEGVLIGDVGVFSIDCGFRKIFNLWDDEESVKAFLSAGSDGEVLYPIPPKPQPFIEASELVAGETVARGAWSKTIYESDDQTITAFEFHHLESHQQGAVLAMTSAGKLEELDEGDKRNLREFISEHAGHVFAYANSIQAIDDHEALYIITGSIKSETWGLAAFTDPVVHPLHTPRLVRTSVGQTRSGNDLQQPIQPTFAWRSLGTFNTHVGRSLVTGSQDQALFFRGFKLDFSQEFRSRAKSKRNLFMGGRGPSDLGGSSQSPGSGEDRSGDGTDASPNSERRSNESSGQAPARPQGDGGGTRKSTQNDSDVVITSFPDDSKQELFHPCDIINKFLLVKTGADFSLSHDDDWAHLVEKCTAPVQGDQENRHNEPPKLRIMDEHEVSQLCAISVRYGVVSLYLERKAQESSVGGGGSTLQSHVFGLRDEIMGYAGEEAEVLPSIANPGIQDHFVDFHFSHLVDEAEPQPRSATEQPSLPPPPPVQAVTQSRPAPPVLIDEPSPIVPPSTSASTPAPPDGSVEEASTARMSSGDLKPRGKPRPGAAPQISVRSRGHAATTSKRKQEKKKQTPPQPLLTTLARAVNEDGRMVYIHEDRSLAASPRPVPPPQPQSIPAQDSTPRHPPHPPPVHLSYGGYGSEALTAQPLYYGPIPNLGPANRYPQAPVYDGGTLAGGLLPPTHPSYSGYPTYPSQAPLRATSSYPQHHHSGYPAPSHSKAPMTAPASDNLAPGGYSNPQVTDNYHGSGPGPSYGVSAGNEAFMKHGVAPWSYNVLPYSPDPATASGASAPNWQDPHTPSVPMQSPSPPQHHYSTWQSHPSDDANWG